MVIFLSLHNIHKKNDQEKVTNSRLATAQVDLTNRKYWAPWAPEDYWVGAHGAHGAQLGPIPDKKKSRKKEEFLF